ncbi:MAG TPA: glycine--tRNA ligase subunit beta, partial [Gammaproteobacteria bacterium]|nr:glycine--tRNA ligase subunit beta [Gammaproteobacteria bacterium]
MKRQDFLLEIGTEELPFSKLKQLSESLLAEFKASLAAAELHYEKINAFATPRRLAILVSNLTSEQPARTLEKKGPAYQAAFTAEGKPTQACIGFACSCGVTPEALQITETDKGKWVYF